MRTRIALSLVALTATIATVQPAEAQQDTEHGKPDIPAWVTRPCQTEDSVNCRWIADKRDNGEGHTFVVHQIPSSHMVCVFYADRHYARTHDHCGVVAKG